MAKLPVLQLNTSIMTPELSALIKGSSVKARFRFELLTNANVSKGFLDCVLEGGGVENNYLADIKRKCSFIVSEFGNFDLIDFINDRIKPYYEIYSPYRNAWLAFPLGVYMISSGTRNIDRKVVTRSVEGFDLTLLLKKKKHLSRYVVPIGSDPIAIVRSLLNDVGLEHDIVDNQDTINDITAVEMSFDPGGEYISTINELLGTVNYRSLWFDHNGIATSGPYVSPQDRLIELGYVTDDASIIAAGASIDINLTDVPNVVQVVVSQPDRPLIVGTARNANPDSPVSTVNAPENIYVSSDQQNITYELQAQAKAFRILTEMNQIYETIQFSTGVVPLHGDNTMLGITHNDLGISDLFSEVEWKIPFRSGELMTHSARRLVILG
jgi:hypothetical protein